MCLSTPKPPKVSPTPVPPPPPQAPEVDQQIIDERDRERRRAASRRGQTSNILAGNAAPAAPTGQGKTLLGA